MAELCILAWKTRHNARNEITLSRFFVKFGSIFYRVESSHDFEDEIDYELKNIKITEIGQNMTQTEIDDYIKSIVGRNSVPLLGVDRSTEMNVRFHQASCDIQRAITSYINGFQGLHNEMDIVGNEYYYNHIDHTEVDIYGDLNTIDTASDLNGSLCSGDTRYHILQACIDEVNAILGFSTFSSQEDEIYEIIRTYEDEIYSDIISYRKALELYPERKDELLTIHTDRWQGSEYWAQIAKLLGLLGG